jgi:hypothetical protein
VAIGRHSTTEPHSGSIVLLMYSLELEDGKLVLIGVQPEGVGFQLNFQVGVGAQSRGSRDGKIAMAVKSI